jgi:superfamily II DNA or RNA helicase
MSLKEITLKNEYRSLLDNVVRDFYVPLLKEAVSYKRAVGFFSSSALAEISKGIGGLVKNGGTIQLVASPYLSEEDVAAIRTGYDKRDGIIKAAILREMTEAKSNLEGERLNLLASLIADGILDIKIAFIEDETKMGMYHEKMGIISDSEGNAVAFSGSNNESATAMFANYETIDVFCSWKGDCERVAAKENAFTSIWNDYEPNLRIIEFPELKDELIVRYKKGTPNFDIDVDQAETLPPIPVKKRAVAVPPDVDLFDYQLDAIAEWKREKYRGIFDMATGTGKTYTGLGAIAELSAELQDHLAVFIVAPFQHLVEQWVEDIVKFSIDPIVGYSSSKQKDWKKRLENAVRDQKLKVRGREFFCFVSTNATFSSGYVQTQIEKLRGNALLVIDEAHNFGAETYAPLLSEQFNYRLALSATLDRHNDEIGTARLYNYFGKKCIEYPLERAIDEKKLTPYKYYPIVVTLNDAELEQYDNLSYEMSKCIIKGKNGKLKLSERGKIVAMNRARLVAGAEDKLEKLNKEIVPYERDKHILIYCGATKVLKPDEDFTEVDEDDMRQIDAVTHILGNVHHMDVAQFTSREDIETRERLKKEFGAGDTLQALVAIKCLDEGVNIPQIKTAFILASTTNPKEYIQRRGRVLRRSPGKDFAEIFDFITLPRQLDEVQALTEEQLKREMTLVHNELCRAEEFARIALNMVEAESVLDDIKSAYGINEHLISFEEDYGYGE